MEPEINSALTKNSPMKEVTINLSYYNQDHVLRKHISCWRSWKKEIRDRFTFCIVDDCSQDQAVEILSDINLNELDIHIYRVKEDLICNIAGVRNLAATVCMTEWMVILDMDTMISEQLAEEILKLVPTPNTTKGECFKFNRRVPGDPSHIKNGKIHPAVCLLRKDDYWNVGGCEEDLVGHYGQTDPIFWHRAKGKLEVNIQDKLFLDYIPDGEAEIDRDRTHNAKVFQEKAKNNDWSTDYIRFDWIKQL